MNIYISMEANKPVIQLAEEQIQQPFPTVWQRKKEKIHIQNVNVSFKGSDFSGGSGEWFKGSDITPLWL